MDGASTACPPGLLRDVTLLPVSASKSQGTENNLHVEIITLLLGIKK